MSSLNGRTNNNKNIPKFPDIGTAGQFIKLKSDVNDGFEYVDDTGVSLPIASSNTLGGILVNGGNLAIASDGLLSATNTTYSEGDGIDIDSNNAISLDKAQASVLGGVKISGGNLAIDSNGLLSATNTTYSEGDGIDIDSNNAISLDKAGANTLGGIKVGTNLAIDSNGILSSTNTTYSEGDGIDIATNNTISINKAQASVLGGVKVSGGSLSIASDGVLSLTNMPSSAELLPTLPDVDGQFLKSVYDSSSGAKSTTFETVNIISDLDNYSQTDEIIINSASHLSLQNEGQTRLQLRDIGTTNTAGRIDLLLAPNFANDTHIGELRFRRCDADGQPRYHSIYTQHSNTTASLNKLTFAIHSQTTVSSQVNVLFLNGAGNAGIGLTPTHGKLQVGGDIFASTSTTTSGKTANANVVCDRIRFYHNEDNWTIGVGASQMFYRTNQARGHCFFGSDFDAGDELMIIRTGVGNPNDGGVVGNVGIGLVVPTEKLEVNGNIKCVDLKFTREDTNGTPQEVLLSTILASYTQLPAVSINSGNKVDLRTNNQTRIRIPDVGGFETEGRVDLLLGGFYSVANPNRGELRFTRADTTNANLTRHHSIFSQHSNTALLNTLRFAIHNGTYSGAGSNTTDALTLTGTGAAIVGSDLIVTGNCQAATYTGLPITTSVIASSTALMTSGGIASLELTSNALPIDEFVLYTVQNMNVNSHDYLWRTPNSNIGSVSNFTTQGIRFVEGNDEFRCSKPGTFIVSFFIVCDDGASNERASFYAQVVKTFGGSELKKYYVGGNSYYRDDNPNFDEVCLCGTITFSLKLDESFLIRSIRLYNQGNGQIPSYSASRLSIERLNTLTVIT